MLYRFNEKECLNGLWDILPVPDGKCDRTSVPTDGYSEGAYLVPSFLNKPCVAVRRPGEEYYHFGAKIVDQPDTDNLYDAFEYPAEWANLSCAYLRRKISVSREAGKRYFLVAEAVGPRATLFVNGKPVLGETEYTLPFEAEVTDFLTDGENEICYLLEDYDCLEGTNKTLWPSGNFIPNGMRGMWQDVYLVTKPDVYVDDVTIVTSYREHTLTVTYDIVNRSAQPFVGKLSARVTECDTDAAALPDLVFDISVEPNGMQTVSRTVSWENPKLWDTDTPFLYWLTADLAGKERVRERFGFREIWIDGINLMFNGHPLHLFADWGHKTTPFYYTEGWIRKWFGMIRDHHMNYSRLHTHPHPPLHMDIADEMGIFICGETGIHGSGACQGTDSPFFWQCAEDHIRRFVKRDKNHPSVILWSVENEMRWNRDKTDLAKKELPRMRELFRTIDPTRPAYHEGDTSWWSEKDQDILSRHYGKECTGFGWWDKKQPLHSGEFCLYHYAGPNNTVHLGGDSTWGEMENVSRCAAEDMRIVSEDARANGVCALGPWNLSCLVNLRTNEEYRPQYDDLTLPGVKPRVVRAGASEFSYWEEGRGYTEQPGTSEANHQAFRPFAVIDLSRRTCFYGDAPLHKTIHLVNDTCHDVNGTLRVTLAQGDRAVHCAELPVSLTRGEIREYSVDLTDDYPEGEYTYRAEVTEGEGEGENVLDRQERTVRMYRHMHTDAKESIYVLDQGMSAGLLASCGVRTVSVASVSEAPDGAVLLIGKNVIREESTINHDIRAFAEKGGRVIILEQQVSPFPGITLEDFPVQTAWRRSYDHPICADTVQDDIRYWGDDPHTLLSGDTYVADRMYVKDDGQYMDVLFDAGEGGFGYGDIHYCPLFCAPEGDGLVIACQFHVSTKYDTVPAAMKLFLSVLKYAQAYRHAARKNDGFAFVENGNDGKQVARALEEARAGKTVLISAVGTDGARLISDATGVPVTLTEEKYGTWNAVRSGDLPELNGISNEDLCGIERFAYDKETADNYRIARYVIEPQDGMTPLAQTCPRAAMIPMYLFGGNSEMLRAYTATNSSYRNHETPKYLICRIPCGKGNVVISTMENLGNKDGKPAPRLERAIRRLRVNLGGELPFESMLCGECTKANENASEGYPKMLYAWDAGEFADTFDALLSCTNYQVERMNPTQALNQYPTYRTLYSEDGVWSAAECPANNGAVLLYYTIFSPVSRKDEGSNLDVPDPSAQTYLDLVGDGEVLLWINGKPQGSVTLDGKGGFSDLELERMFNHVLLRWTPKSADGSLGMQWRNILRVPERTFRFAFTTRF